MLYTKQSYVPASMCDAETKLSTIAVFQVVEDAVTELMGNLHIDGITAMREYDAMWVFVKPHTSQVACFLLPPCGGCPLEASDCLPTFTVFAQITHAAA